MNNGELNLSLPVEVVVLAVGTNNTDCTAHNVFEGICNIVDIIQEKLQNVSVILPVCIRNLHKVYSTQARERSRFRFWGP